MKTMTPETLGRYQILGELGKGAMGVVYLARDPVIGRQVALKTFRLGYSADDEELAQFRARFLREAQSAGILNHANIVTIHDVVDEGNGETCFIAMEYVKGTDLKQLMQRQKRLELPFVIEVVAQIADALDYAHSKGVVHRDVKPANIIITAAKEVKITDFGIARVDASNLTTEGQLLGTPNYMAPEQIQGKEVDHRADLFSLGVMLYEMLTTKKPFQGENLTVVTHRIVYDAFTPPDRYVNDLPPEVLRVLDKALQKDPGQRYQRGSEMARDLRSLLAPATGPVAVEPRTAPSTSFLDVSDVPLPPPAPVAAAPAPPRPVSPAPPRPAPAARSGWLARPPAGRLALGAIGAIVVAMLAGVTLAVASGASPARLFTRQAHDFSHPPNPDLDLQLQYLPHLKQGRQLLEQGQPALALEAFDRALNIAPENRAVRRLRDRAQREILAADGMGFEQSFVTQRLGSARSALSQRDYPQALALASQVLDVDPSNRTAKSIQAEANEGLERKRSTQTRLSGNPLARPRAGEEAPIPAAPVPPPPVAASADATLGIDFFSEISEGVLTIYAGQEQILKESFRFVEKVNVFKSRGTTGQITANRKLRAGVVGLKVYIYRKGAGTQFTELEGDFPGGTTRQLKIRLTADGKLTARLE